jgi:excisionase family DNA binding protein
VEQSDRVIQAAKLAIARVRKRATTADLTPDDLLVALLNQVSRFGIAQIGPLVIDIETLDAEGCTGSATNLQPTYTDQTVAVFERAAGIARRDGSSRIDVVHLLVAFAYEQDGLFQALCSSNGFTPAQWRAELATFEGPRTALASAGGELPSSGPVHGLRLYSTEAAAEYLGVHPQTVRVYIRSGKLPAYRLAGERKIRIRGEDLQALLEPVSLEELTYRDDQ